MIQLHNLHPALISVPLLQYLLPGIVLADGGGIASGYGNSLLSCYVDGLASIQQHVIDINYSGIAGADGQVHSPRISPKVPHIEPYRLHTTMIEIKAPFRDFGLIMH